MKLQTSVVSYAIIGIIILTVLFSVYAAMMPTAQTAGNRFNDSATCSAAGGVYCTNLTPNDCYTACRNNVSASSPVIAYNSIPLNTIFSGTGVVFVLVMAALLIIVIKAFISKK